MVTVASRRPRGSAINLVVRDGYSVTGAIAKNNMLAADQRGSDVVDPDEVSVI